MSHRVERYASTLKHSLGDILINEVHNPELKFVSITHVDVSPDLKSALVFFSFPEGTVKDVKVKLKRATGFIKKMLGKRMMLKYVPELTFIEDIEGRQEKIPVSRGGY